MEKEFESNEDSWTFSDTHDTWIIGFCPDTCSFFVTNLRAFFWESEEQFTSENEGIRYFENNINNLLKVQHDILLRTGGWDANEKTIYLENTRKEYSATSKKYRVMVKKYGWTTIDAESEEDAERVVNDLPDCVFDWSDAGDAEIVEEIKE